MARTAHGVLLAASLVLALHTAAGAQVPAIVTVPASGGEVTILADHIEQIGPENLLIATGNVELTRGTTRLLADRLEVNRDTGDSVAQGRVIFYDGEDRFTASRVDYNLNSGTGVVYEANGRAAPYYRLSGERLDRLGDSIYEVRRGVFTTCDDDPPTWSFRGGTPAHADLNSLVTGTNGSFWVKSLPVLPWVPFFAFATRRERQTGFLFPVFGENNRKGDYLQLPFYWAISDSQDLTATLDAYSKKGIGGSLDYRYILPGGHRGEVTGFFMKETEVKKTAAPTAAGQTTEVNGDTRGWYGWKDSWGILPGISLTTDINGVSDDLVLHDYSDTLLRRSLQQVQSNVFITKSWSWASLVSNFFWYQDLTTERPIELDRLPEIRLDAARQPIPGVPGRVLGEFEGLADHFVRVIGSDGDRVDLHPRVSRPISPAGLFTFTPFVGTRVTGYDRSDTGSRTGKDGVTVETTNNDPSLRRILELGGDFEARASRVYFLRGLGGVDAILHSIEPRVNYSWSGMWGEKHLPQFTDIDALTPQNLTTYSLTNRIMARTVAPEGVEPYRWELLRFVVQQSYDFNAEVRPFSDITGDLIVQPTPWFRWRSDAAYDIYDVGLRSATTDVGLSLPWLLATIGTRLTREAVTNPNGRVVVKPSINFLQANIEAELSRYLVARYTTNFDMVTSTFVENRWGANIRFQCWSVTLEYVRRSEGTNEFRFALNLLGMASPLRWGTTLGGAPTPPGTTTP